MKKLLIILLSLFMLVGCNQKAKVGESVEKEYKEIEGDCVIYYASQDEILSMLNKGTGIVFLSWNGCPWCHGYIDYVNKTARDADLKVLYYDIYDDRNDNTSFYKKIVELISNDVDKYAYKTNGETKAAYDSDGNVRIYVPTVIYVARGEIIGMDYEGSMESDFDKNGEAFFNEDVDGIRREEALLINLEMWSKKVKEVKKEIDESGCDSNTSCEL